MGIAVADVGKGLQGIELGVLDTGGSLVDLARHFQSKTFDLGNLVNTIGPLFESNLDLVNARKIISYSSGAFAGVTVGSTLKELADWEFSSEAELSLPTASMPSTKEASSKTTMPPTVTTPPTTTMLSSTSTSTFNSTSTSTGSSELPIYTRYCIVAERETTTAQFDDFIDKIPKHPSAGEPDKMVFAQNTWQVYTTWLTPSEAAEAEENPIISLVMDSSYKDDPSYSEDCCRVLPKKLDQRAPAPVTLNLVQQLNSPSHLALLSQGPNANAPGGVLGPPSTPYTLSSLGGRGTTIFVIDTGLYPAHLVGYYIYGVNKKRLT
jgi:hypothetical protein